VQAFLGIGWATASLNINDFCNEIGGSRAVVAPRHYSRHWQHQTHLPAAGTSDRAGSRLLLVCTTPAERSPSLEQNEQGITKRAWMEDE
jgi:hypothetical protein